MYEVEGLAKAAGVASPSMIARLVEDKIKAEIDKYGDYHVYFASETGTAILIPKTGLKYTPGEYLASYKDSEEYGFLFESKDTSRNKKPAVRNPFRKESFNLTEQGRITKADPHLAARLKAEAAISNGWSISNQSKPREGPVCQILTRAFMEKRRTRVDPMKYAAIKPKYELGFSVIQLAKEIGVKPQTLRAKASRDKWIYGSMTAEAMATAKAKALLAVTETYEEIVKEVNERQLKKIRRVATLWTR